jgi:predicted outer membrane protein
MTHPRRSRPSQPRWSPRTLNRRPSSRPSPQRRRRSWRPDPTLTADQQKKLADLKALTGASFDKAYAAAQVDAHQATLDALKGYSASGDVPELKSSATGLVPVVTGHLNMAKALKA